MIRDRLEWAFKSFEERGNGETSAQELEELILAKHKQCWIAVNPDNNEILACALTNQLANEQGTVELTQCAGRDRHLWQEALIREIREWARHIGAKRFRAYARVGWAKTLKSSGMRETHRIFEEALS